MPNPIPGMYYFNILAQKKLLVTPEKLGILNLTKSFKLANFD